VSGDLAAVRTVVPYPLTARRLAELRKLRSLTQEQLAERSGLSVRTIRNLELGRVRNPRRSSMDLLAQALQVDTAHELPAGGGPDDGVPWHGSRPLGGAVVGDRADLERLGAAVLGHRLTTFTGPGGVGKTRLALETAARVGGHFPDGVVVVELGDLPPERIPHGDQTAVVLRRVLRHLDATRGGDARRDTARDDRRGRGLRLLVVLDNAEHVPEATVGASRHILAEYPGTHILVTARRRLTERLGVNHEIKPLPVEDGGLDAPAVQVVLRHVGAHADVAQDLPLVTELCRRLGGLPRYLEFAAERLRTIPVRVLLQNGPSADMLCSHDHALLRHQRSVVEGIRWSLDLLTDEHRSLLSWIAAVHTRRWFTLDDVAVHGGGGLPAGVNPLLLLPDLLETSLVVCDHRDRHRYGTAPFVAEVLGRAAAGAH
jgi:predicted ATPase/transcriptional regulator with XRE-family HTH domain